MEELPRTGDPGLELLGEAEADVKDAVVLLVPGLLFLLKEGMNVL